MNYIKDLFESQVKLYTFEKVEETTTETTIGPEHYKVISIDFQYDFLIMNGRNIHNGNDENFKKSISGNIKVSGNYIKCDETILFIIDDRTSRDRMVNALSHLKSYITDDPFSN